MDADEIIANLRSMGSPENVAGMARFGINSQNTLGISVTTLRKVASPIRKELRQAQEMAHALAAELWASGLSTRRGSWR